MVRFKNRYMLLEVHFDSRSASVNSPDLTDLEIYRAIWDAVCSIHGDYGAGAVKVSLSVKVFNPETNIACVRSSKETHELMASALPFVLKIGKYPAVLRTLHVGGSMRSCEKVLLNYHRKRLVTSLPKAKTKIERLAIQKAIKNAK